MNADQLLQMQQMLAGCLNPDNSVRTAAEQSIVSSMNEHREVFIFGLVKLMRTSPEPHCRVLAAIILRQTLPQGETVVFLKLSEQLQGLIKTELLAAITHEPERYVRTQISDTVASLASVLIYRNGWPELFPGLYAMCDPGQTNDALKVCALSILGKLSDAADNLLPQIANLHQVFQLTLAPSNSLSVREAACVACCKIIGIIEEEHVTEYRKFIAPILATLGDALAADDEDVAKKILSGLTEVATEDGKFFEKHLDAVIPAMYAIGADTMNKQLDDGVRQYACEVLIGMAESLPPMIRKSPSFIKHAILVCMSLMLSVDDDDESWSQKAETDSFYDESNFDCGEMNMDRIAITVKGTKLWPVLKPILEQFVGNKQDWRYRHAGLFALAQTCAVLNFKVLPIKEVCAFIRDPHPRVRYAAVQCLGQFPVDFEVVTQNKWHKHIYPALMEPLKDFAHPRIQMHACAALLNMVDGSEPKILKIYIEPLMQLLGALLKQSHQMVQAQVMLVMAAMAGQSPKLFMPYYDAVVPLMKHIIQHANTKETRNLRAKAMESVTFIGLYVGKEKFHQDAKEIMQMFLNIMQTSAANSSANKQAQAQVQAAAIGHGVDSSDDDYSEQHMLQAWSRICTCLGQEFVPVLPLVMPQVFDAITKAEEQQQAMNPNHHRLGDDEEDEDTNVSKHGVVKSISAMAEASAASDAVSDRPTTLMYNNRAHTAAMEDKAMAMSMLCSFAHDLQEGFIPYVKRAAEIMIPLIDHPHDEVQAHAIACMPHLFKCAVEAHKKGAASMEFCKVLLEAIIDQLVDVFPREVDAQTLQSMVVSLHECIDEAGPLVREVIDQKALSSIGGALLKLLEKSHERIARREELLAREEHEGDLDEERVVEIESRNASEDGLNTIVANAISSLIKSHQEQFLPVFDQLYKEILRMLSVNSLPGTKKIAIFIIDDIIEHLGERAAKYFPDVLEAMCIYASDHKEEAGLRQAAAYGITVAARHGGAAFQPFKGEIIKRFVHCIQSDATFLKRNPEDPVGQEFIPVDDQDEGESAGAQGGDEDEEGGDYDEEGEYEEEDDDDDYDPDERARWSALDNVVSALGAIAFYQNQPDLLPVWLSFLPLRIDDPEAPTVYNMLLTLIEQNNPLILGENMANLPKILSVFLVLVNTNMLKDKELRARVGKFFLHVKGMPQPLLQEVAKHLRPALQEKFANLLNSI